jgi:hypothetical protein
MYIVKNGIKEWNFFFYCDKSPFIYKGFHSYQFMGKNMVRRLTFDILKITHLTLAKIRAIIVIIKL